MELQKKKVKKKECKAQISIEYIMILGFVTFVIISILGVAIFYTSSIKDRIRANHVNNYANKVVSTAEYVFYSGEPSKATIVCYLPDGVRDVEITSNNLVINFSTGNGENVIAFDSTVPIIENAARPLSSTQGLKRIEITTTSGNAIIGQAN